MTHPEAYMNQSAIDGNLLAEPRIRVTALGVFLRNNRIFVAHGYDPVKQADFYRPLGGGIEFGERGEDTIVREMREETGLEITNVRYLGLCENIFTYLGEPGHEIVLLYQADFVDQSLYEIDELTCEEIDGIPFTAVWKHIDEFGRNGNGPLYPAGLMDLLSTTRS